MSFTRSGPSGKALNRNASSGGRNSSLPEATLLGLDWPRTAATPFEVSPAADEEDAGASVVREAPWAWTAPVPSTRRAGVNEIPTTICLSMGGFSGLASRKYRGHFSGLCLD